MQTILKLSTFVLLAMLVTLPGCAMESPSKVQKVESTNIQKQERWDAMVKEVDSWADAIGLGIDPEIKKMVIILNLLGFKTEQSCEGHLDWGRPYPWVTITVQTTELQSLDNDRKLIWNEIEEKRTKIHKKYPELSLGEALRKEGSSGEMDAFYVKGHALNAQIEKQAKLKIVPLRNLVADFYQQHPVNPDTMLALSEFGFDAFDLHSNGGDWQIIRDDQERQLKFQEYRTEMNKFADFLIDYYFKQ